MKKCIMVLEANRKAALPVMESMAKAGFHVIGCAPNRLNCGFFSRYCHERVVSPSPLRNSDQFKSWLLGVVAARGVDMLFPVGQSTYQVSEVQNDIRRTTKLILPQHEIFRKGYAKIPTLKAAQLCGRSDSEDLVSG